MLQRKICENKHWKCFNFKLSTCVSDSKASIASKGIETLHVKSLFRKELPSCTSDIRKFSKLTKLLRLCFLATMLPARYRVGI